MNLKRSNVIFSADTHEYWLGEKQLKGISHLYGKHINPSKYEGIPESVLMKAAERGSRIHDECRQLDMFGVATSPEAIAYSELKAKYNIEPVANEYLVSDNENFATMIDMADDAFNLYDFKTTSTLDEESLSWQLSICAHLFEQQNPDLKAGKLFGIWLRNGQAKLVEVPRIATETIYDLLDCEVTGRTFVKPTTALPTNVDEALVKLAEFEGFIALAEAEMESKKRDIEAIKEFLLEQMTANNIKKWETDNIVVTYVAPSERKSVDSTRLKSEQPDIYEQYSKVTNVKEQIKIKVK